MAHKLQLHNNLVEETHADRELKFCHKYDCVFESVKSDLNYQQEVVSSVFTERSVAGALFVGLVFFRLGKDCVFIVFKMLV